MTRGAPTAVDGAAFIEGKMVVVPAISISRSVREWLERGRGSGRVLAVFERACDLLGDDGQVVGVVLPDVGDGPLNVVVSGQPTWLRTLPSGAEVVFAPDGLRIGPVKVDLSSAAVWEPAPDWGRLRRGRAAVACRLPFVHRLTLREAPPESLVALLAPPSEVSHPTARVTSAALSALPALREGWGGDRRRLSQGVRQLAGLGGGLTPSGDDLLMGLMLRAWVDHPAPKEFCAVVSRAAAPATTTLSAAFLRAAAQGQCSAAWHRLLGALADGSEADLSVALRTVLSVGATSGADSLAGFLLPSAWIGGPGTGG